MDQATWLQWVLQNAGQTAANLRGYSDQQQKKLLLQELLHGTPGAPQMGPTLPGDTGGLQGMTRGPGQPGMATGLDPRLMQAMAKMPGGEDMLIQALVAQQLKKPDRQALMNVEGRVFDPNKREWVTEAAPEGLSPYETERLKREDRRLALAEERARRPGRAAADPLVEVYDPESPTGTRFVPRSQAAGRAGKPGSGLQIETSPDGTVRVTQGRTPTGAKGQPPEGAAKTQLVEQGVGNVRALRERLFLPDGSVDRVKLGKMAVNLPGEGRKLNMQITQAIRAKLRVETGAVISDDEIAAEYGQFFPSVTDTAENVAARLDQLEQFLAGTGARINPPGSPGAAPAAPAASAAPAPPRFGDIVDGYRFKGGNPADPNSWEPVQ